MVIASLFDRAYEVLLSPRVRERAEKSILVIAIFGFLVHLLLIVLADFGVLSVGADSKLLSNPIVATYTPFSFIIVYEVYMLVYYLPRSITTYISKQYEIITLIIIRRVFKDLGNLEITSNWFDISGDLQFTYDLIASLVLFYLLYLFVLKGKQSVPENHEDRPQLANLARFIRFKKGLSVLLIPILFGLATYTFVTWSLGTITPQQWDAPTIQEHQQHLFRSVLHHSDRGGRNSSSLLLFSYQTISQGHAEFRFHRLHHTDPAVFFHRGLG